MDSWIVRVGTVATSCVLIAAVAVPSFADASGSNVTGEEHMDPQNSRDVGRTSPYSGVTNSPGWGVVVPVSGVDSSNDRYLGGRSLLLEADLKRIVPGASLVPPSSIPKGQRVLAVHAGLQTVYVMFKGEEEKKRYVADLTRYLANMGLEVRPSGRTQGAEATPPDAATSMKFRGGRQRLTP